jgi:pimeloyl-ACP methyl ester carboxylesterase
MSSAAPVSNVVLVHGGFVDGSGWQGVYSILTRRGYHVSVVQNPTLSLAGDVTATRQVIDDQPGPVVLVGRSYGGMVITEAGTHEKVAGSKVTEVAASHPVFLSQPAAVADLIEQAAAG